MSDKCDKCKKTIGFFGKKAECDHEDCKKTYCNSCGEKTLKQCENCEQEYCPSHHSKTSHACEENMEEDTKDDANSEDTEEDNDEDPITFYGKNDKWATLNLDMFEYYEDYFEVIDEKLPNYELLFQDDSTIWILKKKGT